MTPVYSAGTAFCGGPFLDLTGKDIMKGVHNLCKTERKEPESKQPPMLSEPVYLPKVQHQALPNLTNENGGQLNQNLLNRNLLNEGSEMPSLSDKHSEQKKAGTVELNALQDRQVSHKQRVNLPAL